MSQVSAMAGAARPTAAVAQSSCASVVFILWLPLLGGPVADPIIGS